jgi:hypothetical protein
VPFWQFCAILRPSHGGVGRGSVRLRTGRPAYVQVLLILGKSHQNSCPRSESPVTYMRAIEGELVLRGSGDRADGWIRWTTIGCIALIAGTVSYLHMHMLVALHGQPGWVAALTLLSVDGMIMAAATAALLADSRSGRQGVVLP